MSTPSCYSYSYKQNLSPEEKEKEGSDDNHDKANEERSQKDSNSYCTTSLSSINLEQQRKKQEQLLQAFKMQLPKANEILPKQKNSSEQAKTIKSDILRLFPKFVGAFQERESLNKPFLVANQIGITNSSYNVHSNQFQMSSNLGFKTSSSNYPNIPNRNISPNGETINYQLSLKDYFKKLKIVYDRFKEEKIELTTIQFSQSIKSSQSCCLYNFDTLFYDLRQRNKSFLLKYGDSNSKQNLQSSSIKQLPCKTETNSNSTCSQPPTQPKLINLPSKLIQQKVTTNLEALKEDEKNVPHINFQDNPNILSFESRFESGNLAKAGIVKEDEYSLLLQNDINTQGYAMWFFFSVKNKKVQKNVTFHIQNFRKSESLFTSGMKVMVYSKKLSQEEGKGWHRGGENIIYQKNSFYSFNKKYHTLTFNYKFLREQDEVFFAYNYPYTYTQLQDYLKEIETSHQSILSRRLLCRTLAGNRVDLLTITSPQMISEKQGIILSARVHPGETVSSFIMKGIIDFLISDSSEAKLLRERFVFKIVPMLNPDGVIHGNYRCSLSGSDLNRKWKNPSRMLHPEIFYFKKTIFETAQNLKIALFCDLHGHSVKKNIFVYGCHDKKQPLACRELPYLLSKMHSPFSFQDCNFRVQRSKEGTARIAIFRALGVPNIFTLESSFCGTSYEDIHFSQTDLEMMGSRLCQAFLVYFTVPTSSTSDGNKQDQFLLDLKSSHLKELWNKDLKEIETMGMDESSGSDSCPSEDDISLKEIIKVFQRPQTNKNSPQMEFSPQRMKKLNSSTHQANSANCSSLSSNHQQNSFSDIKISFLTKEGKVSSHLSASLSDHLQFNQIPYSSQSPQQLQQASRSNYKFFSNALSVKPFISGNNNEMQTGNSEINDSFVNKSKNESQKASLIPLKNTMFSFDLKAPSILNLKSIFEKGNMQALLDKEKQNSLSPAKISIPQQFNDEQKCFSKSKLKTKQLPVLNSKSNINMMEKREQMNNDHKSYTRLKFKSSYEPAPPSLPKEEESYDNKVSPSSQKGKEIEQRQDTLPINDLNQSGDGSQQLLEKISQIGRDQNQIINSAFKSQKRSTLMKFNSSSTHEKSQNSNKIIEAFQGMNQDGYQSNQIGDKASTIQQLKLNSILLLKDQDNKLFLKRKQPSSSIEKVSLNSSQNIENDEVSSPMKRFILQKMQAQYQIPQQQYQKVTQQIQQQQMQQQQQQQQQLEQYSEKGNLGQTDTTLITKRKKKYESPIQQINFMTEENEHQDSSHQSISRIKKPSLVDIIESERSNIAFQNQRSRVCSSGGAIFDITNNSIRNSISSFSDLNEVRNPKPIYSNLSTSQQQLNKLKQMPQAFQIVRESGLSRGLNTSHYSKKDYSMKNSLPDLNEESYANVSSKYTKKKMDNNNSNHLYELASEKGICQMNIRDELEIKEVLKIESKDKEEAQENTSFKKIQSKQQKTFSSPFENYSNNHMAMTYSVNPQVEQKQKQQLSQCPSLGNKSKRSNSNSSQQNLLPSSKRKSHDFQQRNVSTNDLRLLQTALTIDHINSSSQMLQFPFANKTLYNKIHKTSQSTIPSSALTRSQENFKFQADDIVFESVPRQLTSSILPLEHIERASSQKQIYSTTQISFPTNSTNRNRTQSSELSYYLAEGFSPEYIQNSENKNKVF